MPDDAMIAAAAAVTPEPPLPRLPNTREDSKGAMGEPQVFAGGDGTLRRPGGLCFDPRGNLLVTSVDGRVHMYGDDGALGTSRAVPLGVYAAMDEDPMLSGRMSFGRPWDVALVEGKVCVTAHSSRSSFNTAAVVLLPPAAV